MTIITKLAKATAISAIVITTSLLAGESTEAQTSQVTFKTVMQGLLANMQLVTQGIVMENFNQIATASAKIADHPKPDMAIRKKVMMSLASEMGTFKSFDNVVHGAASKMTIAAKEKNMEEVVSQYQTLIAGCQSCHAIYKARVTKILQ